MLSEHSQYLIVQSIQDCLYRMQAPHVLMRPRISADGNQWCALYGDNLHDGIAGFGKTPEAACENFDRNWKTETLKTWKDKQ